MKIDTISLFLATIMLLNILLIINSFKGQKQASKLIQAYNPDWKPDNWFMRILWSLFKHKG